MSMVIAAFILGIVCGLRSMVGLAAASWAARDQVLPLEGTSLAFLGFRFTPLVTTLFGVGEIINDKLPKTPSRLIPPQFTGRVVMGALTGSAIGMTQHYLLIGAFSGIVGSVAGTLGGAKARGFLAKFLGNDLPAALLEDVIAIGLAVFVIVIVL